jgi:hypothetical protein
LGAAAALEALAVVSSEREREKRRAGRKEDVEWRSFAVKKM